MLKKIPQTDHLVLCPNEEPPPAELPGRLLFQDLAEGTVYQVRSRRGQASIVVLRDGAPRAFDARCPHMGADLTKATCVGADNRIQCPWHGYRFGGDTGVIVENPNEEAMKVIRIASPNFDQDLKPPFKLRDYDVEVVDGWVYVK